MKKNILLQRLMVIIMTTFMQLTIGSFIADKTGVTEVEQFMQAAQDGDQEKLRALHEKDRNLLNCKDSSEKWRSTMQQPTLSRKVS